MGTVPGVLLTTMIGYVLSRPNYKLKGFFTWMVFIPMIPVWWEWVGSYIGVGLFEFAV